MPSFLIRTYMGGMEWERHLNFTPPSESNKIEKCLHMAHVRVFQNGVSQACLCVPCHHSILLLVVLLVLLYMCPTTLLVFLAVAEMH